MKQSFIQNTKRFFCMLSQNRGVYFITFLINIIWSVNAIIHILFLEKIVNTLENQPIENFYTLIYLYIGYIALYVIFSVTTYQKGWTETYNVAMNYLYNKYLPKFIVLDNNTLEKHGTGKLTAIIRGGIERWAEFILQIIEKGTSLIITVIFAIYMLAKSNSLFLFVFVLLYIGVYILSYYLNTKVLEYRRKRRNHGHSHTKNLIKVFMNKQEIMQSEKIDLELKILTHHSNKEIYYNKKMAAFLAPMFEIPNILLTLLIIAVFYYLGIGYYDGNMEISTIVGIVSALALMQSSIERGILFFKDFTKNFTDIEKLWEFFDTTPELSGYETGEEFIYKKGDIHIKNLSYSYTEGKPVFENLNLDIAGGSVIALVGNSGGGKSTIAKLIAGYLQYDNGEIEIDGQKLSELSLKSYYKNIGYLTQDPSVFDGTILDNLTYAITGEVSEEKINEVIQLANCEFIYDLPNRIDTEIGERGVKLSGGQKQRLAIAKIMLKDPRIIILDEPTSALDSFSESQITEAMNHLFEDRTVIVIAHRLQTVKHADTIYFLESGKIIENGTHEELLKKKGKYYEMIELQSGF